MFLKSCKICIFFTLSTIGSSVCTMGLYNLLHIHACLVFQIVNILGKVVEKNPLVLEHLDEVMSGGGVVLSQVQMLGKLVEWFRLLNKV